MSMRQMPAPRRAISLSLRRFGFGASGRGARRAPGAQLVAVVLAGGALGACSRPADRPAPPTVDTAPKAGAEARAEAPIGYPRGAYWREPERLARVVVKASHVLISYASDRPARTQLWMPVRPTARTRAEALALARDLHERATAAPELFDELARQHSDDEASGPQGGGLGVFRAMRLSPPLVDAVAATEPGQISRVVESELGFHIIKREVAPAEPAMLSARRVLIGHRAARPEGMRPGRGERERAEARQLAEALHERAGRDPAEFDAIVREHSDGLDAGGGGDWGEWSTHEAGAEPLALDVLARTPPGSLTPVVDTRWGFQIFLRTEPEPRERLAASTLVVSHEGSARFALARPAPRPDEEARRLAGELLGRARREPGSFEALRAEHCDAWLCRGAPAPWTRGRMMPEVERAVLALRPGEFAPAPVETLLGYVLVRREDPALVAPPDPGRAATTVEFPSVAPWGLDEYVTQLDGPRLALFTRQFAHHASERLALAGEEHTRFDALFGGLAAALEAAPPERRLELIRDAEREASLALGSRRFAELVVLRERWLERMTKILVNRPPSPRSATK